MSDRFSSNVKPATIGLVKDRMEGSSMMHDFEILEKRDVEFWESSCFGGDMTVVSEITQPRKKYHGAMEVICDGGDVQLQLPQILYDHRPNKRCMKNSKRGGL